MVFQIGTQQRYDRPWRRRLVDVILISAPLVMMLWFAIVGFVIWRSVSWVSTQLQRPVQDCPLNRPPRPDRRSSDREFALTSFPDTETRITD